jgi:uncharacterized membrane protein
MRQSKKRAMTWSLVAIGVVMLAVAGVLLATFPWQQGSFPFAHMWSQGQGLSQGQGQGLSQGQGVPQPGPGAWYGYQHGWFMHGPRFFGGGLLIALFVILAIGFFARRWRSWGSWGHDEPDHRLDAEEILRRTFAEGKITEEEYTSRLSALRK